MKDSKLRGAAVQVFPPALKWETCSMAAGEPKYVICNGDEGDPGAFMDRNILESNPHQVIEGMIICAHAVGASRVIFIFAPNTRRQFCGLSRLFNRPGRKGCWGPDHGERL